MAAENQADLNEWNQSRSLASDLIACFFDYELSESELNDKWGKLPPRDELLVTVRQKQTDDQNTFINEVARWVQSWDEEYINMPSHRRVQFSSSAGSAD